MMFKNTWSQDMLSDVVSWLAHGNQRSLDENGGGRWELGSRHMNARPEYVQ